MHIVYNKIINAKFPHVATVYLEMTDKDMTTNKIIYTMVDGKRIRYVKKCKIFVDWLIDNCGKPDKLYSFMSLENSGKFLIYFENPEDMFKFKLAFE